MENIDNNKRVGAGIITMSALYLFGQTFTILGCLINIFGKDFISNVLAETGTGAQVNTAQIVITLVKSLIITTAVILILFKKSIGAFLFIGIEILSFVYSAIIAGVNIYTPLNLIFPALMIFFMYRKKDIYFVKQ